MPASHQVEGNTQQLDMAVWDPRGRSRQETLIGSHGREMGVEAMGVGETPQERLAKALDRRV